MGLAIVLLFWIVIGSVLATCAAVFLMGVTALLTRKVQQGRTLAIAAAGVLPFVCLAWAGIVATGLAIADPLIFDRDIGVGDSWYTPLPNGYRLLMIDVTDKADICLPRVMETCEEAPLPDVKNLQLSGPYMMGEFVGPPTTFFLFDTRNGRRIDFQSRERLAAASVSQGFTLNLRPVYDIYLDYRITWLDGLGIAAILLPPVLGTILGFFWVLRLRQRPA